MPAKSSKLSHLKNIGQTTEQWLNEVGIHTLDDLEQVGALDAWRRIQAARPRDVTLVGLYALQGALLDVHWNALPPAVKEELKSRAQPYL